MRTGLEIDKKGTGHVKSEVPEVVHPGELLSSICSIWRTLAQNSGHYRGVLRYKQNPALLCLEFCTELVASQPGYSRILEKDHRRITGITKMVGI